MDYQNDIKIDESALDVEWLGQSELGIKWGNHWVECSDKCDRALEKLKVIKAKLTAEVSENPEKILGKGVKVTSPIIEAYYRTHKTHIQAKEEWLIAKKELGYAEVAKWQISNTRKEALENLVKLHGQNYFASPNMPRDLSEEVARREERQQRSNEGVASKMKRTKK